MAGRRVAAGMKDPPPYLKQWLQQQQQQCAALLCLALPILLAAVSPAQRC